MKRQFLKFLLLVIFPVLNGQNVYDILPGQVSFISSQNIYVKFKSTNGIASGDTLFISSGNKLIPSLLVENLSSTSCVCRPVSDHTFTISDLIFAKVIRKADKKAEIDSKAIAKEVRPVIVSDTTSPDLISKKEYSEIIRGSISAYSYSDISNTAGDNSQRFRYTLSLYAKNISDSRFSFENYISFRHKTGDWGEVKSNVFNALKIYTLAVKYDLNKSTNISLGRIINPSISSIGAADGFQFQKIFDKFSTGFLAGTRPDYSDYGLNIKLLQFGAWVAYKTQKEGKYTESSMAFMQQMNNGQTDRRFVYFQHSNSIIKNVSFFGTFEVDMYKLETDILNNQISKSTFNPTGIYLSLNYKASKALSVSGSYDARKNVIYYETYKTFLDRILETEMRQGFRLQANYRFTKDIIFGVQSGYRYLKSDPGSSKNVYGYITYNQIPGLNLTGTVSATYLESGYLNGTIIGGRLSKDIFNDKIQVGAGYRYVDYTLPENKLKIKQNIAEADISWQIYDKLSFSVSYEGTFEKTDHYNRFYLQLRKRF